MLTITGAFARDLLRLFSLLHPHAYSTRILARDFLIEHRSHFRQLDPSGLYVLEDEKRREKRIEECLIRILQVKNNLLHSYREMAIVTVIL